MKSSIAAALVLTFGVAAYVHAQAPGGAIEWPNYGNDPGAQRYSTLNQINRDNVSRLKVSWTFHTGDVSNGENTRMKTGFENTPIVIDGTMYISTPFCRVIAIDPTTGPQKWSFDPNIAKDQIYSEGLINRGVASWLDPAAKSDALCRRRISIGTLNTRVMAL